MTILAETSGFGDIFTNVLLVVHVMICLILCLAVLMQRPKQEGLGTAFGGGMADQAFGPAGTADVLQKGTVYLASALFVVTLILSILVGSASTDKKISDSIDEDKASAVEENGAAAAAAAASLEETTVNEDDLDAMIKEATADLKSEVSSEVVPEDSVTPAEETTPTEETEEEPADQ